ncbi:ATP-grasp domain-containing protein [Streptomyces sp. GQFP]|uniref:ATP-grasp domain-containing protein n=1 Tax=Streptomyces sp. GQFP TaxID=2907545 RepID=UPI001F2642A0|nr:ATP-grasp domain-containing protein [Streptomyces sp. GQFP]UIX32768.1 ATP-grasp domain-containing protein [Streptomyces sp. GQFP]
MGGVGRRSSVFLTSGQRTSTTVLLAEAAAGRGMAVRSLADAGALTASAEAAVHWCGGPLAADIADALALGLLEPPDDWLAELPEEFTGRRVELTTLAEAWQARHPVFAKPPSDKSFPAAVYADGARHPRTGEGVSPDTAVLVSDIVTFAVEYRLFVLDGRVAAGSRYAVYGRLDPDVVLQAAGPSGAGHSGGREVPESGARGVRLRGEAFMRSCRGEPSNRGSGSA